MLLPGGRRATGGLAWRAEVAAELADTAIGWIVGDFRRIIWLWYCFGLGVDVTRDIPRSRSVGTKAAPKIIQYAR